MAPKKSTAANKAAAKQQAATNVPPPGAETGPGSRSRRRTRPSPAIDAADDQTRTEELIGQSGEGGETHQTAGDDTTRLTTQQGVPVADDQNTLRAGERGPSLLEDFHFREKIFHFDHERIPERVVHARGFGAHGFFETYESLADITRADLFQRAGERTEVFVRFSTVAGNKGSSDLARDVRGFAVEVLHARGQLGSRRQQHPGVLHPGRRSSSPTSSTPSSRSPIAASRRPSRRTTTSGTSSP